MGLYRDTGKENGNYYSILRLYRDNGKENGNSYSILGLYRDNGKEHGNYYSILVHRRSRRQALVTVGNKFQMAFKL